MRIVLLGPPGAGKGSLALLYEARLKLAHLSTGEIFRQEISKGSILGRRVQHYVANGRLVPDTLVVQVMASRLSQAARRGGFVLDGFPRTKGQAVGLDRVLKRRKQPLDGAVYITSPRELLIRRLSGRRVCATCGANYHVLTMRPKRPGRCDRCKSVLTTRKDDQPATIRKRLRLDQQTVKPLLDYYKRQGLLQPLNGIGYIETVYVRSLKLFRRLGWLTRDHDRAQVRQRT